MDNIIWCEDCKFFGNSDMGGEGYCFEFNKSTWYGCNAEKCEKFLNINR